MKVTFKASELQRRITQLGSVISSKAPTPAYALVQFYAKPGEQTQFIGTSLAATLTVFLKEESVTTGDGEVSLLLNYQHFAKVIAGYPYSEGYFDVEDGKVTLRGPKKYRAVLEVKSEPDFRVPLPAEGEPITLRLADLQQQIAEVEYAIDTKNTKFSVTTVRLEARGDKGALTMIASDGFRIVFSTKSVNVGTFDATLPKSALDLIKGLDGSENVTMYQSESGFCFRTEKEYLTVQRTGGEFPKYEGILPKTHKTTIEVPKSLFEAVVKAMEPLADADKPVVIFSVTSGGKNEAGEYVPTAGSLKLEAEHVRAGTGTDLTFDDVGSDEIEDGILVTGPAATFSMDVKMLGEFLRQVKMDKIRIQTKAADTVVDFWASETFRYLQMPTRPKPAPAPAA